MNATYHVPVLLNESIEGLNVRPEGIYLDGTLGGGGHFQAIVDKLGQNGTAIGIDRDPESVSWVRGHVNNSNTRVIIEQSDFSGFDRVLDANGIGAVDGILLDIGMSSRQIDATERGFSYLHDNSPLDMRMNPSRGQPAYELLDELSCDELSGIFRGYGEIENPGRMARAIKGHAVKSGIRTSGDLKKCLTVEYGTVSIKLLSKLFQALRIAVNRELDELESCLKKAVGRLSEGGRLAVISYHSLEDRIVKNFIRSHENACTCPREAPVCVCKNFSTLKRITRKAIRPSEAEIVANRRSRSARLRIAERLPVLVEAAGPAA
jgi:16S rRNA (cytosine1402-N4)-methyltransferase